MPKLLLLGGPTGVGKSTILSLLAARLSNTAVLDADDVWRISPDLAIDGTRGIAIANVVAVMRGYAEANRGLGILTWVFAKPELYEPVIAGLRDSFESIHQLYMVASPEKLELRLTERGHADRLEYSITRLRLIEKLPYPKIDTTNLTPAEASDRILGHIRSSGIR